jgi:hypothetical protein
VVLIDIKAPANIAVFLQVENYNGVRFSFFEVQRTERALDVFLDRLHLTISREAQP